MDELTRVAASVSLVIIAILISRWRSTNLEKDLIVAAVRGFVQLLAIGYALEFIFNLDTPLWTLTLLSIMTVVAGRTAAQRGERVPGAGWIALASIGLGSAVTLGILVSLKVFAFDPQTIIPVGGMVIGNAMSTASLVMNRLADDLHTERGLIETALALGATSQQASRPQLRKALQGAMIPIVDTTKTVGIIKLPGAMTGMILAGASPMQAVITQIVVMYMIIGATTFTGLSASYLTFKQFFTPAHQLVNTSQPDSPR
jgi:putative ABC transport system permease protein